MKLKLFKKYFFTTALIIIFSLTVMMMILSFVLNNYLARSKYETLGKCTDEAADYIAEASSGDMNMQELYKTLNAISAVSDVDIFLANKTGAVVLCSCEEWGKNGECTHSQHLIPESELAADENEPFRLKTLDVYKNRIMWFQSG